MKLIEDVTTHDLLIVGSGLAGMSAAIEAHDAGADVAILSKVHPLRSHSQAALACKTQISALDTSKPVTLEPLLHSSVVRDLVVDQGPFFASLRRIRPWLAEGGRDPREPYTFDQSMSPNTRDQFLRATDCIMCQSCFSDCPKRREAPSFAGPATCLAAFKRIHKVGEGIAAIHSPTLTPRSPTRWSA